VSVLREDSSFRTAWDRAILALALASCLLVPYLVVFSHEVGLLSSLLVYAIDAVFLADVWLNHRTTFRREGSEVTERAEIARRYRRGLLPIDLAASVPIDAAFLLADGGLVGGISVVLLVRLLRLLRVVRIFAIFRRWERQSWTNSGLLRIAKFSCVIGLLMHWIACAWFFVPFLEGFPRNSWVVLAGVDTATPLSQYIRSLYWAIVTMTTVGYGDITPSRDVEYVFTMVVMLLGASMYAFIIGNIASLFSNLDSAKAAHWNRMEAVSQYLRARRVPRALNDRIRGYYEYLWERHRGLNESQLFTDLPDATRLEVLLHLAGEVLESVPLFRHCSPALRNALLLALRPEIHAPGGFVVREGEAGDGIYFLTHGTAAITSEPEDRTHGVLESGESFGDLSMLLGEHRTASVKAVTYCDVFVLTRSEFERIKSEYEEFRDVLRRASAQRTEKVSDLVLEGVIL
jgi:voltage-gated potassium channel Kch